MKKILIAVGGLVVVLVIALVVLMLVKPKSAVDHFESDDTESLYSYSYESSEKGLKVMITGEFPEGFHWIADCDDTRITVAPQKSGANEASFLIQRSQFGSSTIRFLLRSEGEASQTAYEIAVVVASGSDGRLAVVSNTHREVAGSISGVGEKFSYQITPLDGGDLQIVIHSEDNLVWNVSQRGNSVHTEQVADETNPNDFAVVLSQTSASQSNVQISNETDCLMVYVSCDQQGVVSLLEHGVTALEDMDAPNEEYEFDLVIGNVKLPYSCSGVTKSISNEEKSIGRIGFLYGEWYWALYVSDKATAREMGFVAAEGHPAAVGNVSVTYGSVKDYNAAAWEADGVTYVLLNMEAEQSEMTSSVNEIVTVVCGG